MKIKEIEQPATQPNRNYPQPRQVLKVQGRNCIIPAGLKVIDMNGLTELIVGNLTPGVTFDQKIRLNNDVLPLLTIETIVHECTHGFQERRMGWLGYRSTYFWQMLLALFTVGPAHIHADHPMEKEARFVGQWISTKMLTQPGDINIENEIELLMNWPMI